MKKHIKENINQWIFGPGLFIAYSLFSNIVYFYKEGMWNWPRIQDHITFAVIMIIIYLLVGLIQKK